MQHVQVPELGITGSKEENGCNESNGGGGP